MCTMKEVCKEIGMNYETLKFYCKEGLVPNVKRDKNNYRNFDEKNIAWLKGIQCLRKCGLGVSEIKIYLNYCLQGPTSIPQRKDMLSQTKEHLLKRIAEINECIEYIDNKQSFYDDVLEGKCRYTSNLIEINE